MSGYRKMFLHQSPSGGAVNVRSGEPLTRQQKPTQSLDSIM